ncbi:immunity 17 family protein [Zavarzinella formosa]|uniref:immunity 17 family protein n=1 Tax=Zavarzinella formosa TaxID=360055 RepID=UPI000363228E|nr:immunity 17 family protein [Zavarzinella formosa]
MAVRCPRCNAFREQEDAPCACGRASAWQSWPGWADKNKTLSASITDSVTSEGERNKDISDERLMAVVVAFIVLGVVSFLLIHDGCEMQTALWTAGFFAGGLFGLVGAAFNADWFFEHPKTQSLVRRFGRPGARLVCVFMSLFVIAWAGWLLAEEGYFKRWL